MKRSSPSRVPGALPGQQKQGLTQQGSGDLVWTAEAGDWPWRVLGAQPGQQRQG